MGKIIDSANIVEKDATGKSIMKKAKNKIRKKLKLRDFVKSPVSQQSYKISTWLNTSDKNISSCSSKGEYSKYDSKNETRILNTNHVTKKSKQLEKSKGIQFDVQKQKLDVTPTKKKHNTDKVAVRTSPRLHSSQKSSSVVRKQLFTEFESSTGSDKSSIGREKGNVTPTKQKYTDETTLRRSPRGLKSPNSPPSAVPKKLFEADNVLPEETESLTKKELNVTPTKQNVKNDTVLRRSPRIEQKEFNRKKEETDSIRRSTTEVTKIPKNKCGISSSSSRLEKWLTTDKKISKESSKDIKNRKNKVSKKEYRNKSQEDVRSGRKIEKLSIQKSVDNDKNAIKKRDKVNRNKYNVDKKQRKKIDTCHTSQEKITNGKLSIKQNVYKSRSQEKLELQYKIESFDLKIEHKDKEKNNNGTKEYDKSHKTKRIEKSVRKIEQVDSKNETKIRRKQSSHREFDKSDKKHKTKTKVKEKENSDTSNKPKKKTDKTPDLHKKQGKLDKYLEKNVKEKPKKTKLSRINCDSSELPSFGNANKKCKSSKTTTESFKKYGVTLPTVAEILKEQSDLENYKNQIQAFQEIEFENFNFSVGDLIKDETNPLPILGCKHLTSEEITDLFKKNEAYISDIFYGKTFNERHEKFMSIKSGNNLLMVKELTHSTSMVIFTFEQKQHMLQLLKEKFDTKDEWTSYFFQVLLPELCLIIFMDIHGMARQEAVDYLDVRPIDD